MHAAVAVGEGEALWSFLEEFGDKEDDCLIRYLFYLFNCTMLCSMWSITWKYKKIITAAGMFSYGMMNSPPSS